MVDQIAPVPTGRGPTDPEKQSAAVSPAETGTSFPEDKVISVARTGTANMGELKFDLEVTVNQKTHRPASHRPASLPERPRKKPFWRRHLHWLLTIFALVVIFVSVLVGVTTYHTKAPIPSAVTNNTLHTVASSGLFLNDKTTWNMQTFWQNSTGGINLQMSLDGKTFEASRTVALKIEPRVGSPMAATAEIDPTTGVVTLNLFYISGEYNISMSVITCPPNSASCNTIDNCYIPTTSAPNEYTGLAAVNINDAQDWRVYFYDEAGILSEIAGNSSGFDMGTPFGGSALNSSGIAAVNVNSTTNNINVFYVDQLTEALFTTEFTDGAWTLPTTVSPDRVVSWNPTSGLAAAYSNSTDQIHVYYTGIDSGVYEFLGSNASTTNTTYAAQPGRNHIWATADYPGADISAVGWLDEVRFFQVAQGKMVQGILNHTIWTETFVSSVALRR